MNPTPHTPSGAREENTLTPAEFIGRLPLDRRLEHVTIETTRDPEPITGSAYPSLTRAPYQVRLEPDSGARTQFYGGDELVAVTMDGERFQIVKPLVNEDIVAPVVELGEAEPAAPVTGVNAEPPPDPEEPASPKAPDGQIEALRARFEQEIPHGAHVTIKLLEEDDPYTGRLLAFQSSTGEAEFIHPETGEPQTISLVSIEDITSVIPDESPIEIHRKEDVVSAGFLREMARCGDEEVLMLELENGLARSAVLYTERGTSGAAEVFGFSDPLTGDALDLDLRITGFYEELPDKDYRDGFAAGAEEDERVTPEEILAAELARLIDSRDRETEIRVGFHRVSAATGTVTSEFVQTGRVLEFDEDTRFGKFQGKGKAVRFELEEIEIPIEDGENRLAYRYRVQSGVKTAPPKPPEPGGEADDGSPGGTLPPEKEPGAKFIAEEEKLLSLLATGQAVFFSLRDGDSSFRKKARLVSYDQETRLGVIRTSAEGEEIIFALEDNDRSKPTYRVHTYGEAVTLGYKGADPDSDEDLPASPKPKAPAQRSGRGKKKSGAADPARIYDRLLGARTADRVTLHFKDGRAINGALIFTPGQGTGRIINIEQELSLDFHVDDLRDVT